MRTTLITLFLAITAAESVLADPVPLPGWTRTRSLSASATELLASAAERSSIVVTLLEELERSDIVVYLTDLAPPAINGPMSHLVFLARDPSSRYLLVRIDHWRLSPEERIALLGHELQHALEVAAAPEVLDGPGLAKLYRRIGWESQKDRFESEAAKAVGSRVRSELQRGGKRPPKAAYLAPSSS